MPQLVNLTKFRINVLLTDNGEDYGWPVAHDRGTGNDTKDNIFYRTWSLRLESDLEQHTLSNYVANTGGTYRCIVRSVFPFQVWSFHKNVISTIKLHYE